VRIARADELLVGERHERIGALERAQRPVADTTVVRELTNYCRTTIEC